MLQGYLLQFQQLRTLFSGTRALEPFRLYWRLYGGWKALLGSVYLYAAVVITVVSVPFWKTVDNSGGVPWAQAAVEIIPSILGFSMGGMAVMLAFSSSNFFKHLAEDGNPKSLFAEVIANFFHFVLVQVVGLVLALLAKGTPNFFLSLVGFFFLSYAMMVAIATAGQLLRIARILNMAASVPEDRKKDDKSN